jgi:hypothetical protein
MSTGGLVTIIPCLSDFDGNLQIAGINQEFIDRLSQRKAEFHPPMDIWGSDDPRLVNYWNERSFFWVRERRIIYSSLIDAEIGKCILNNMVNEAGIKTYLHAWGTMPIMDGNKPVGVIFESKSGRQAIMAKVVIDSTGDGDLLPFTGAKFDTDIDPRIRIANLSLCYWIDNVNLVKVEDFRRENPDKWGEMMMELMQKGGHPGFMRSNLPNQEKVVWVHPRYANKSQTDVEELTRVEMLGRERCSLPLIILKRISPALKRALLCSHHRSLGQGAQGGCMAITWLHQRISSAMSPSRIQ